MVMWFPPATHSSLGWERNQLGLTQDEGRGRCWQEKCQPYGREDEVKLGRDARGVEGREVLMGLRNRCCGHADKKEGREFDFFSGYTQVMPWLGSKQSHQIVFFCRSPAFLKVLLESSGNPKGVSHLPREFAHEVPSPFPPSPAQEKVTLGMLVPSEGPVAHEAQRGLR